MTKYRLHLSRHRVARTVTIVVAIVSTTVAITALVQLFHNVQIVHYAKNGGITATPSEVCPGETFTFPVNISVSVTPTIIDVVESWCRADNICVSKYTTSTRIALSKNIANISLTARRVVPSDMQPGQWTLHHVTINQVTDHFTITGYYVDVTIKDCARP